MEVTTSAYLGCENSCESVWITEFVRAMLEDWVAQRTPSRLPLLSKPFYEGRGTNMAHVVISMRDDEMQHTCDPGTPCRSMRTFKPYLRHWVAWFQVLELLGNRGCHDTGVGTYPFYGIHKVRILIQHQFGHEWPTNQSLPVQYGKALHQRYRRPNIQSCTRWKL